MAKRKSTSPVEERPICFKSEGRQIVGMHHKTQGDKIILLCHGFTGAKTENKRLFVEAARHFAAEGL